MRSTVKLHGLLGQEFGQEFHLEIATPQEALRALNVLRPGFNEWLKSHDKEGIHYRVLLNGVDHSSTDDFLKPSKLIEIIPGPQAAGRGAGMIVAGIVLIAISVAVPGASAATQPTTAALFGTAGSLGFVGTFGVALVLGGVAQLLTPQPSLDIDPSSGKSSSTFGGARTTVGQGQPVPLAYGKIMAGSARIEVAIESQDVVNS